MNRVSLHAVGMDNSSSILLPENLKATLNAILFHQGFKNRCLTKTNPPKFFKVLVWVSECVVHRLCDYGVQTSLRNSMDRVVIYMHVINEGIHSVFTEINLSNHCNKSCNKKLR